MEWKFPVRNFGLPRKVVLFSRNPEKSCSTGFVTGSLWEFNLVSKTEKGTLCLFSTSSPGPLIPMHDFQSHGWLVVRRPWSRLGQVVQYLHKSLEKGCSFPNRFFDWLSKQ